MKEVFVSNIHVKEARVVKDLTVPLSDTERKHLIITGKNGCGKTSLLLEINKYLNCLVNGKIKNRQDQINALDSFKNNLSKLKTSKQDSKTNLKIAQLNDHKRQFENLLKEYGTSEIKFYNEHLLWEKTDKGSFIVIFFDATRKANIKLPNGVTKVNLQQRYNLNAQANINFIQYIVNLKAESSFARDDGDVETVSIIDTWFDNFQNRLRDIFESPELKLKFDRKNFTFQIIEKDKEPYGFNTLSDGYSAILTIVTELLLRMEAHKAKNYDMEGLVLIDEIETHLHVELQKKILPFLTDFFPKTQFIVTTHSPFVLSSISNAVICDLEKKSITSDFSGYSYDAIIETFFNSDKYSDLVKEKISEYEELSLKNTLDPEQKFKLKQLKKYFTSIPKHLTDELQIKLNEIELNSNYV